MTEVDQDNEITLDEALGDDFEMLKALTKQQFVDRCQSKMNAAVDRLTDVLTSVVTADMSRMTTKSVDSSARDVKAAQGAPFAGLAAVKFG